MAADVAAERPGGVRTGLLRRLWSLRHGRSWRRRRGTWIPPASRNSKRRRKSWTGRAGRDPMDAYATLHLRPDAPPGSVVKAAFRALSTPSPKRFRRKRRA